MKLKFTWLSALLTVFALLAACAEPVTPPIPEPPSGPEMPEVLLPDLEPGGLDDPFAGG